MGTANSSGVVLLPFLIFLILLPSQFCYVVYNITRSNFLPKGQTLASPRGIFELGFFGFNNYQNQYVGIWYKNITPQIVVWVANREKPLTDSGANLTISSNGNLVLLDSKLDIIWSSRANFTSNSSYAELLDNGNFVLKDVISGDVLWESFNHPCNILLPNSTLTNNPKTGERRLLTSWKSNTDPSPGEYVLEIFPQVPPQAFIKKGSVPYWRSGPWSKTKFIGIEGMDASYDNAFRVDQDITHGTVYFLYGSYGNPTYMVITPEGSLKILEKEEKNWNINWDSMESLCDFYGACGPFGVCMRSEHPKCECLKGFVPRSHHEWKNGNWTGGCMRRAELLCERNLSSGSIKKKKDDVFYKMARMKVPDLHEYLRFRGLEECLNECLQNCSCLAYAFVDGIGCLIWKKQLLDTVQFSLDGEDLFIRLAHSELGDNNGSKALVASLITISVLTICSAVLYGFCRHRGLQCGAKGIYKENGQEYAWRSNLIQEDASDVHFFGIHTILIATDNFSMSNKLGQGGFGPVYKGKLPDGKEIAVKRLSSSSGQGIEEFKNEILLISKLRHRNLVRLLGCCIENEEKLLIYEFMINRSLDTYLFDPPKKVELDWAKRFNIIQGIARGLLYLHRDSSLRIVHRDLKVSNILLDEKMNPKISDFGLARMFQGTQDLTNTQRVVGTLGYMSPEYALGGLFSEKSDVFSFGVLLLEIVSGQKTSSFKYDDESQSLHAYAWKFWCECEGQKLVDQALADSYSATELMRCVHIALLCVQDHAMDRPNMFQVVSMLNSDTELPQPKQPTFTFQNVHPRSVTKSDDFVSINEITETTIEGR